MHGNAQFQEKSENINLVSNLWAKMSNVIYMLFTYCLFVPFKPLLFLWQSGDE